MPTVETTVSVTVPEGATVAEIEGRVRAALRAAGGRLLAEAVEAVEEVALRSKDVLQDKSRTVDLLTSFGWLRLERSYVRERRTGKYRYLVEMGGRQEHATAGVVEQAVALATRMPYRQAALLLGRLLGEHIDHRSLYAWVKAEGQQLVDEAAAAQEAVFVDGAVPDRDERERELVVAVVDGTYLKAQREGQPSFEVRIGVAYSGRSLESATARHKLTASESAKSTEALIPLRTSVSASTFTARPHSPSAALATCSSLAMAPTGSSPWRAMSGIRPPTSSTTGTILDHARRTFPDRPQLVADIARALHDGDADRILRLVTLARLTAEANSERIQQYESYLRTNLHGIHGARRLRAALSPQARSAAVDGSGAVEKQGDLLVARRFEHAGMR